MNEGQEKLLKDLEVCITAEFARNNIEHDELQKCIDGIMIIVNNYEVISKCTELVVVKTSNPKLAKLYVACLRLNGKSEKTVKQYFRTCRLFSEFINKSYLDVNAYDVRLYLSMLRNRGCKNRTLDVQKSYIAAFYRWLVLEGYLNRSPVDKVGNIKFIEKEKLPFSDVEIDAMRSVCNGKRHRAIFEMLLHTGARASELCNLNIQDIDLENRVAYIINGKGGKDRKVYFNQLTVKYYKEYLEIRKDNDEAAFTSLLGKRISPSGVRSIVKKLGAKSGVNNVHPHRFRRTLATNLAERGMPLNEIMVILGHSSLNTTRIYIHTNDRLVENSYERCYS